MRVEKTYVVKEEEPTEWREKVVKALGQGVISYLQAAGLLAARRHRIPVATQTLSEEPPKQSDKGRVVDRKHDPRG